MAQLVRIPGVPVMLDGREFIIPPITLGPLMQLQAGIEKITDNVSMLSPENMDTILAAAHACIKRNYPDITRESLLEIVDVSNLQDLFNAIIDVGGLRRKALESAEGKTAPETTPALSNGGTSWPTSAPVQDGPGTM